MGPILKPGLKQYSAVYVIAIVIAFIVVMAIGWFSLGQVLGPVQAVGRDVAFSVGGVNSLYISVDQFFTLVFMFFLALSVFGLILWAFMYSQSKGEAMY